MATIFFYYFIAFVFFVSCLIGLQKWNKLPQPRKDKVGLTVLVTFLSWLFIFILLLIFQPTILSVESTISITMMFIFLLFVFTTLFLAWYNEKYSKQINISRVVIVISLTIFGVVFLLLKLGANDDKEKIIKNVETKTVITNITFDAHKPYFKDMTLADGQFLPMPETMNNKVQIGDSIYKFKGQDFYLVVANNIKTKYRVAIHSRILSKPQ